MKYLLMIWTTEEQVTPAAGKAIHESYGVFGRENAKAILGGNALEPSRTARNVRVRNGERMVTDGPYMETKEQLGGYYLVEAADVNAALELAAKVPGAKSGTIEVRPVLDMS